MKLMIATIMSLFIVLSGGLMSYASPDLNTSEQQVMEAGDNYTEQSGDPIHGHAIATCAASCVGTTSFSYAPVQKPTFVSNRRNLPINLYADSLSSTPDRRPPRV